MSHTPLPRLVLPALLATAGALTTLAIAAITPPSVPNMGDSSDSGISHTDNITNVAQPVFSGTGQPFSVVTLFDGATQVGVAVVMPSGQWTVGTNIKLSDGPHAMTVRQATNGVQSAPSAALKIVVDRQAPAAPSRADLATESDHGSSDVDNITNTTNPIFQGTGTPGTFISLYNSMVSSTAPIGSATVSAQGTWKAFGKVPPSSGATSYFIVARARDVAGNASSTSDVLAIFVDTQKPASASLPNLVSADDSGASNTDNITNKTTPTFTVKTEPNGRVVLWGHQPGYELIGTAFANSSGYASIKAVKPLNSYYTVVADGYDLAGNKASTSSATLNLNIDTVAPAAPGTPKLDPDDDTGVYGDSITNLKTARVRGYSRVEGDTLALSYIKDSPNGPIYHATANIKFSAWSVAAPSLPDGVYNVRATDTDLAGNSSSSEFYKFTVDTTPPPVPSTPNLCSDSDTGVSNTDDVTNETLLEFVGTCPGAQSITLYNNGLPVASRDAGVNDWVVRVNLAKGGQFHISATAKDVAGNISAMSPQLTGLLDTTAPSSFLTTPAAPVVKNLDFLAGTAQDVKFDGDSSGIDKVSVGLRRFTESGNSFWSGSSWGSANKELPSTFVNGQWSKSTGLPTVGINQATQIQDGEYWILMVVHDKAGNISESKSIVMVDNTAPYLAVTSPGMNSVNQVFPKIYGSTQDANGVTEVKISLQRKRNNVVYYWNGVAFTTAVATVNATATAAGSVPGNKFFNWNFNNKLPKATDLDVGPYAVYASAYDSVGNVTTTPPRYFSLTGANIIPTSPRSAPSGSGGSS